LIFHGNFLSFISNGCKQTVESYDFLRQIYSTF
jgi:hypothetical protein